MFNTKTISDHPALWKLNFIRNQKFNDKVEELFGYLKPLYIVDLCTSPDMVSNWNEDGHICYGLQCEPDKPFQFLIENFKKEWNPFKADVVTMFSLPPEENFPVICENVLKLLRPEGLWFLGVPKDRDAQRYVDMIVEAGLFYYPHLSGQNYFSESDWIGSETTRMVVGS